jgi:hypothetical protein
MYDFDLIYGPWHRFPLRELHLRALRHMASAALLISPSSAMQRPAATQY